MIKLSYLFLRSQCSFFSTDLASPAAVLLCKTCIFLLPQGRSKTNILICVGALLIGQKSVFVFFKDIHIFFFCTSVGSNAQKQIWFNQFLVAQASTHASLNKNIIKIVYLFNRSFQENVLQQAENSRVPVFLGFFFFFNSVVFKKFVIIFEFHSCVVILSMTIQGMTTIENTFQAFSVT